MTHPAPLLDIQPLLDDWLARRWLRPLDVRFAAFLAELDPDADPRVCPKPTPLLGAISLTPALANAPSTAAFKCSASVGFSRLPNSGCLGQIKSGWCFPINVE